MSGLAALCHTDGRSVDPEAMRAMLSAISYRGPDGMSCRLWGKVGLGLAKMAVTPEEQDEQQPLVSPRTGCGIIADVRLDNREELLCRLPGQLSRDLSDTELILRAYEEWGTDAVRHLLGDFAFIIWEPRAQRIVAARDTSGQRTLFYRVDARTFAAASEIHQLLQDPSVPHEPNDEKIRESLIPWYAYRNPRDGASTFYKGILALPAGHLLVFDDGSLRVHQYWRLDPPPELRYRRDDEYAEHYLDLLSEVIRTRLRSIHPVGALLSGGLDSSSLVCVAQELYRAGKAQGAGMTAFTAVFDGLECDERHLVRDIEAKYGLPVQYFPAEECDGKLQLRPQGFMEAPHVRSANPNDPMWSRVSQVGVRGVLTGDIADACVYGSRLVFDSLLRQGKFRAFWRHFQAFRRVSSEPVGKTLALACVAPLLPLDLQRRFMAWYLQRRFTELRNSLIPAWVPEALRQELAHRHVSLCLSAERGRRFSSPAREEEYQLLCPPERAWSPPGWPITVLRPFADRRLHNFLLAVSSEQKFQPHPETDEFYAGSKWLVRRALRGILPESIRTRTNKTVFTDSISSELVRQWPTYEAAFGPNAISEVALRGYVDQKRFWSRLCEVRDGRDVSDLIYMFQVVGLETWLRGFGQTRTDAIQVPVGTTSRFSPLVIREADALAPV